MPDNIRMLVFVLGLLIFIGVFGSLIKRRLYESVSVLWIIVSMIAFMTAIFPQAVERLAGLANVSYPPTLIIVLAICFLIYVVYNHSTKIAVQEAKILELTMQLSIIKEESLHNIEIGKNKPAEEVLNEDSYLWR